jgi:S1-C subfamily serine protease
MDRLLDLVETQTPGSTVTLEVYRQGHKLKLQLTVEVSSNRG